MKTKNRKRKNSTAEFVGEDEKPPGLSGRRKFLHLAAGASAVLATSSVAWARGYPSRPITIIVGYAAGGPTDTRTRILVQYMKKSLGQSILVENVTGASGSIGAGRVARATPDGYTLFSGDWSTHVVNGAIYSLPYDVARDFEPIGQLSSTPLLMITRNAVPATGTRELLAWLEANQHKVSFATSGPGSPSHASGLLLQKMTGMQFRFVPYRGGALFLQDLIAGQIDLAFGAASNVLPAVRDGKIKAYAVTSPARWTAAPEIPTVDEGGLPELHVSLWGGMWAPKGAPGAVIDTLNASLVEALSDPTARQRLADLGEDIPAREQQTPAALAAHQRAEIEKWWPIIKAAGVEAE
jgi:tripartite-type tricarboxylate transporter receptor subunit TctC